MLAGCPKDRFISSFAQLLVKRENKSRKSKEKVGGNYVPPFIVLSVDYRLAPEHPFPSAIVDCLSVTSYILKSFPTISINIGGISAGGNLAAAVSLQSYKCFPGRLNSTMIMQPMLDPLCNSMSFTLNSPYSGIIAGESLRWVWRAYLELSIDHSDNQFDKDMKKCLENCPWKEKEDMWRLCCPQFGISKVPSSSSSSPIFIVSTATADPLEDDGINLIKVLKQSGFNVTHNRCIGNHYISLETDAKGRKNMIESWHDSIWGQNVVPMEL